MKQLVADVVAGNRRAIARMMSLAESTHPSGRAALSAIYPHAGRAHVIGLTGVPGSGKSTLVQSLAVAFRSRSMRVGIVCVDPSSPFTGGAIMGDRIRMGQLAMDDGVFIRSLATRGALGGLARACLDTVDVLDAAGFDLVMIETVGVGQDEVDIAGAAHSIVVVSAPGLGDGVQAIKAGVLEIADIHVVSKCDKADAQQTITDLNAMMGLGLQGRDRMGWKVPVLATSAETGEGIAELCDVVLTHGDHLKSSGELKVRQRNIAEMRILKAAQDRLREIMEGDGRAKMESLLAQTLDRSLDPNQAAEQLIQGLRVG
ncbi:MAG: methylmalonyl Co-A mutase-associated GTPase MeaB [Rhodospirillales bacterium]|nr:methylmalonyl Co-A mutase-associated GTPase MeaB [Rhodospirillales bacterium]